MASPHAGPYHRCMSMEAGRQPITSNGSATSPAAVVEAFLKAMQEEDIEAAMALVDDDIAYTNVSLPTLHGKGRMEKFLAGLDRPQLGFEVYIHAMSTEGSTVLTERTDVLIFGSVRVQLWVCGRFDVNDGRITIWRDYFDWFALTKGVLRGLVGAVVPALGPKPPRS